MELLVGCTGDDGSRDAVALGAALARTFDASLVLAHVRPPAWSVPGSGKVDAEWDGYLQSRSEVILNEARRDAEDELAGLGVTEVVGQHRSSGTGLAELAERRGSDGIVIGSAPGGSDGRVGGGSTSDQLLHGSPVPVTLATAGFRRRAPERFTRAVVAYEVGAASGHALQVAIRYAESAGLAVHLVTLLVRTRVYGSKLGSSAEAGVIQELRRSAVAAHGAVAAEQPAGVTLTSEVVLGDDVTSALAQVSWQPEDLFVVGSSTRGPLQRVFLGDTTFKLVRAASTPVVVAPRQ